MTDTRMGPGTITLGSLERDYARNQWPGSYSFHPLPNEWRIISPVGNVLTIPGRDVMRHTDGTISLRNDLVVCDGYDDDGIPVNEWAGTLRAGVWTQTWGM